MKASFKKNLIISYGTSLFLLVVSSVASFISIQNLMESQRMLNHTNTIITKLENVLSVLKDGETGQRGYLLSGNDDFLEPYLNASAKSNRLMDEVKSLTIDNPLQQRSVEQLREISNKRLVQLQKLIDDKRKGINPSVEDLELGKVQMDESRRIVQVMQDREQVLLHQRSGSVAKFAGYTTILLIIAGILSILVTVVSFLRVNSDFDRRAELQKELEDKDADISKRLNLIQGIADKISAGNYKIRVDDLGKDTLGAISNSLNRMAESLDKSFENLSQNEWLQAGIAALNEKLIGERNLDNLSFQALDYVTSYSQSQVGAIYLLRDEHTLVLTSSVGLNKNRSRQELRLGEGLAGQAAMAGREVVLSNIADAEMLVDYSAGSLRPKSVVAIPIYFERKMVGVIELASLYGYTKAGMDFLKAAAFNVGIAVNGALDHQRLQDLLAETQAQSEELQVQHSELENINEELEAQSQKLQASEEELRVQQEELQQANQELEERSRLLEERNELILERNLEIQSKAEALAQSTRYKSEFLANMSHELRTPLNSILLLSRLLSENHPGNLSNEQVEYADVIQSSGNGLLTLIDEILDLSKIESGKMQLEYNFVALDDIASEMRALFNPLAKDKHINFRIVLGEDLPNMIETDQLRLQQILRNLISNALKFTARGEVVLEISKSGDVISFSVKDTGIGIAQDKQRTIFEAFQQADGSTRRKYGGTGLGLSISRELAKLLGGEISLESQEGQGSTFTLTVPAHKVAGEQPHTDIFSIPEAATEILTARESQVSAAMEPKYIASHIPQPVPDDRDNIQPDDKVILVIEDDTNFANALLAYTRQNGYKCIVAVRGDEGVTLAQQFLPAGILLDIELPVKSGWEVMEELKSNVATRAIPVHVMSSHEVKIRSISRGAVDFINKPVAMDRLGEVFHKIEQALRNEPKKVLIVEENLKHARGLAYFLESFDIATEIKDTVGEGLQALNRSEVDCVILDMGIPAQGSYDVLEEVKKAPGFENVPIIIFTGKNLSHVEEFRIKQYADSIVLKTAHSYQRILDEVSLFLHLVEEKKKESSLVKNRRLGELTEVLKGKTVLIADDDVRNIFSLTKSLEAYGMKIVSAIDGKEALRQLEDNPQVDLILMDMMMPEMDGYESTRRIREKPGYKNLPIIAVTAKAMTGDREKCINAGASDYITKPVDVDQLISLLRVWLYE
ncbi:Signal transduction histidine kinase [Chitinophaga jiangningensis]|uniref:histidine kinase n=1 Tax=Chitinophaga jiangningensis TaxID=1419482 RepID=A0A1M7F9D8_9BACT|nr:response regulator [Chitinophaga jiangningensis]SHM00319.1 Signal transduction histidine kinase [Chitinophaga jiangningensis]